MSPYRPCPFCGSKNIAIDDAYQHGTRAYCRACNANGPLIRGPEPENHVALAWVGWNQRVPIEEPQP